MFVPCTLFEPRLTEAFVYSDAEILRAKQKACAIRLVWHLLLCTDATDSFTQKKEEEKAATATASGK
jgi:hypothetical protein